MECSYIDLIIWGGVYMRKLAPVQVSYRDDFLILYCVYMMTGSFHILLFEGTLYIDKIHVWFKITNITHVLDSFQSTGRPISHCFWWNVWSFCIYMIPLWDFVRVWISRPGTTAKVNSPWGNSCRHDIFWCYRVNNCGAMRGNRS